MFCACDEPPTAEQQKLIDEQHHLDELRAKGKCADEEIIVEIDGIQLKVPRYGTDIIFNDGRNLSGLSEVPYMCDLKIAKSVERISSNTRGTIQSAKNYKERKKYILDFYKVNNPSDPSQVAGGVEKINNSIFLLHDSRLQTQDHEPVLIRCSSTPETYVQDDGRVIRPKGMCNALYLHPRGLMIAYRFFSHIEDFIDKELKKREEIDSFLINYTHGYGEEK